MGARPGGAMTGPDESRQAAREGRLDRDGRIAALSLALLAELGFRAGDDLTGLSVASLWPLGDRAAVAAALVQAGRGDPARLALDMGYLTGEPLSREILVEPAPDGALSLRLTG